MDNKLQKLIEDEQLSEESLEELEIIAHDYEKHEREEEKRLKMMKEKNGYTD